MVGVYYRPPNQEELADEALLLQLQETSCSQSLILLEDFRHLDVCWESHITGSKQFRRLLESIEDIFLIQVLDKLTRGEELLVLVLTNVEELIKAVKIEGNLGCSDRLSEFVILRDKGLTKSKVKTLIFRKAKFQLFKEVVNEIPQDTVLRDKGSNQSCQLFKDIFLGAQVLSIPIHNKSSMKGRKVGMVK